MQHRVDGMQVIERLQRVLGKRIDRMPMRERGTTQPCGLQAGGARCHHIQMRVVADMQHRFRRCISDAAGRLEDARIRLGATNRMRVHCACEQIAESYPLDIGVAIGHRHQPIALRPAREHRAHIVEAGHALTGLQKNSKGLLGQRRIVTVRTHCPAQTLTAHEIQIVAAVGICGAIAGYFVTQAFTWRASFLIGGGLGLGLLALRFGVVESGMFSAVQRAHRPGRGAVWRLFWPRERLVRYLSVVLIALPIWYVVGVCVKYSDVIARSMGILESERPAPGRAIMWCYVGLAVGDLASGLASQCWRSRRAAIAAFLGITALGLVGYFLLGRMQASLGLTYAIIVLLGFGIGYWAVFVTTAAEHFGTDLRATAATTAPNLVRWSAAGSGALWLLVERWIGIDDPAAPWQAAAITGLIVMSLAALGWFGLRETYGTSLDWTEG